MKMVWINVYWGFAMCQVLSWGNDQWAVSVEGLIINISGFAGSTVSVTTTQLCGCSVKVDDR